ncbi:acyl-CoA dehydrogenase [Agarilytica rhodophyticola]|uniref:acyl-CoA dehydrogenase family protein n=1 Tax=Agarilytica rhodophyticola TaxID=1737490 RepID=UPI000B3486C7|nr:acyl-CoA dehydrogenase [Agarilytica rhodophyticola]
MDIQSKDFLKNFIYNNSFEKNHQDLLTLLRNEIFERREGLNLTQSGELSYERSRFIHKEIESPLDVLANPDRLFALAEWAGLLDVSCFSIIMVHYNLTMGTFFDHALKNKGVADFVEELDSLSSFGPYMATELGYGNNVAALKTQAVYDHEEKCFYLNTPDQLSQKYMSYSGFSHIPKIAVVMARLIIKDKDYGVFPFAVRISDLDGLCEGITAIPCPEKPVQGLDNGLTSFNHIKISLNQALFGEIAEINENGEFVAKIKNVRARFLKSMSRIMPGRLCVSSAALGGGKASCYIALKFAQHRLTNAPGGQDTAIINFLPYQREMFINLAKIYAMSALTNNGKSRFLSIDGDIDSELTSQINLTKALVTWEMTDVIISCRERCGAQGIFSVNRITEYISLLQGLVTAEGDNQVLIATVAAQLVNMEYTPGSQVYDNGDKYDSFTPESITGLIALREKNLIKEISEHRLSFNGTFFDEWNSISNDAIHLSKLWGYRVAIETMINWKSESVESQNLIKALANLFGLYVIQKDIGWYIDSGKLSKNLLMSINKQMDGLCSELLPKVDEIIEAFGYDEDLFKSPICYPEYQRVFTDFAKSSRTKLLEESL